MVACEIVAIEPACIDIRVQRGTDNTFEFVLTDGDGTAVDIIADDVMFTVKDEIDGITQIQKTSLAGSHLEGSFGKVEFTVARTEIDDEVDSTSDTFWVYEIRRQVGGAGGDEHVHIRGEFIIEPSVGI